MTRCFASRAALSLAALGLSGCLMLRPGALGEESASLGTTSSGWLLLGTALPDRGLGFERARPGESTRVGTTRLVRALERAALEVERAFPGGRPIRVGDLGAPLGGRHPRHRSHRAGRDVDILFQLTDASGAPVAPRGRVALSRFGIALDPEEDAIVLFDDARNWHLVRTLLSDPSIAVQWIFCSHGIEARLLRHALAVEPDRALLVRAAQVLQEPSNAPPHDDHFHVRVFCSREERALGCRDTGPIWPWLRADHDPIERGELRDDARLIELLDAPFEEVTGS